MKIKYHRLENAIKNLQNDLTENTLMINRDLMERFKNLGKVAGVKE